MKKITVHVDREGGTQISTEGFTGTTCQDATKQLEKALGIVTENKHTDEYYATSSVDQSIKHSH